MTSGTDEARLARIRTTVLCIWAIVACMTPYPVYARLPEELSVAQGIGRVLLDVDWLRSALWSERTLAVLKWLAVAGCLAAIVAGRRHRRWLMPAVCVLVVALDALTKSITGYVNHAQIAPLAVLVLVTVFDERRDARATLWLVRFALLVPYTFLGFNRLVEGGPGIVFGDALLHYIEQNSAGYSYYGFTLGLRLIEWPLVVVLLKTGFAIMTLLEVLAVGALLSPRFGVFWALAMAGFHLATLPILNILFWENLLLIVVAFGPSALRARPPGGRATTAG